MSEVAEHQRAVQQALRTIAQSADPDVCFPALLRSVLSTTHASAATLWMFGDLALQYTTTMDDMLPEIAHIYPVVEAQQAPIDINDDLAQIMGWPNAIVGCVRLHGSLIGAVAFTTETDDSTDPEYFNALETILNMIAVYMRHLHSQARHEKLMRNQSEFIRIVSHDLRTPLTSIKGFASMLEAASVGDMNDKQLHFVEKILSGILQLTYLVDNMQDAGRYDPETGFYEMERTPVDLTEVAARIVENHLVPAEKQDLNLQTDIGDDIPIISADLTMFERAITNLVDNAIKYTPNGGQVVVGVHRLNDDLVISIKDNGLGIDPENQKTLFERGVRVVRKEHVRVKGSGLGLFIVRSVALRHGGDAWVESELGSGSSFFIRVPLDAENAIIN